MNLKICAKLPEETRFIVSVNDKHQELDAITKQVSFDIKDTGIYTVLLEQVPDKSNRKLCYFLFYLITIGLQGIFHILFMNTDSKWYKNIKAYCIKAKFLVEVSKNSEVRIQYTNAVYDEVGERWLPPVFHITPPVKTEVAFLKNECDFGNQYFNFIKKIVSVAVVAMTLFMFLLIVTIDSINYLAAGIISVIMVGICITVTGISITQYKKFKKLHLQFSKQPFPPK